MDYFKTLFDQLKDFWKQSNPMSRFGMIATVAACFAMILAVGYWSSLPTYVTVADRLEPDEAAKIVGQLEKSGIKAKLNFSATAVLADESKVSDARAIAAESAPDNVSKPVNPGFMGGSESTRRDIRFRNLERRLETSIMGFHGIEKATVHLFVGKSSLVRSMSQDSTAGVLLTISRGAQIPSDYGNTIARLVASGVPGLQMENVQVMDDRGRMLTKADTFIGASSDQIALKRDTERYLQMKAESILTPLVGLGKARVEVTADLDLTRKTSRTKKISPDGKVEIFSKRNSEKTRVRGSGGGVGVPGTGSNSTNNSDNTGKPLTTKETEENQSEFVVGSTEMEQVELADLVKQLHVAVVVDLSPGEDTQNSTKVDKAEVEALIKSAVGFNDTRGDTIKVFDSRIVDNPFLDIPPEVPAAVSNDFILKIVRQSSLGLGAVFAFVIGFLMIRKMKPITVTEKEPQISPERTKHLSELGIVARENPELLSRIVAAWINETPLESESRNTAESGRSAA